MHNDCHVGWQVAVAVIQLAGHMVTLSERHDSEKTLTNNQQPYVLKSNVISEKGTSLLFDSFCQSFQKILKYLFFSCFVEIESSYGDLVL